jgi:hypothetical protein
LYPPQCFVLVVAKVKKEKNFDFVFQDSMGQGFMLWATLLFVLVCSTAGAATPPSSDPATNVTYITGTCKKTTPAFNISKYFNQQAMLVKNPATISDLSNAKWDLAKDGAFAGYNVYMCLMSPTSYPNSPPPGFCKVADMEERAPV